MAMTDTTAASSAATVEGALETERVASPRAPGGLAGILGDGDHKMIGRLFIGTSLLFGGVTGVTGALVGAERLDTADVTVLDDSFLQVFTLHSVSGLFLFLLPLLLGIALYVVPLQVGARTIAFPRAAAASFWVWLVSGALVIASYAMNGGPGGGDAEGVDLFTVSMAALIVALVLATVCVVTTVLTLRAPGMGLDRTPLFSWSMLVAGTLWLLSLPVLFGLLVLHYLDTRYGAGLLGGSAGIYPRMGWMFGQPQVYSFAIPALGIIADIVPVFARSRQRFHVAVMGLIAVAGAFSFGAWTFIQVASDGPVQVASPDLVEEVLYVAMAFVIVAPLLGLVGAWTDTVRRGRARLESPLVFAVAALAMLLAGAGAGAIAVIGPLDLAGSTFATGQQHYVLGAAAIAAIGGLHYWAPKLFGRTLSEGAGMLSALLLLGGVVALALPDLVSGVLDQQRGSFESVGGGPVRDGVETLNLLSLLGGGLLVLGVVVFAANLVGALARRTPDSPIADDPWQGHTLEWATASPPPAGNFGDLPTLRSAHPLLDLAEPAPAPVAPGPEDIGEGAR